MKKIKVLVIKPTSIEVRDIKNNYINFKEAIDIESPIDCITRNIGGKDYDIWCDDEGLFKENLQAIAINTDWNETIVGNILIANSRNGKSTSLTDKDIDRIISELKTPSISTNYVYNCSMGKLLVH